MNKNKKCFEAAVIQGQKLGRKIGFPTANFDPALFPESLEDGVYASKIKIGDQEYLGALFYGPKATFDEIKNTLEVYILDFDKKIYGETLQICIGQFIRETVKFDSVEKLVSQIEDDVKKIRELA